MPIVNFSIPQNLETKVNKIIIAKGFSSKAEFFRLSAIFFIETMEKPAFSEEDRFNYLTKSVTNEIIARYKNKKIPSLKDQLAEI